MDLSSTAFPINRFDNATTGYFADALEFEEDRSRCLGNNSTESAGVTYLKICILCYIRAAGFDGLLIA